MFNIVIVDDERIIRMGLRAYFQEDLKSYFVLEDFDNAEDTITYLKQNHEKVDVVLADICLPRDNGIEVAKQIFENQWNIVVILISGHKEFAYVKQAFKYNVYNYLEKPINFEELDEIFGKLEEELKWKKHRTFSAWEKEENALRFIGFLTAAYTGLYADKTQMEKQLKQLQLSPELMMLPCARLSLECTDSVENVQKYGKGSMDNVLSNCLLNPYIDFYPMYENDGYREMIAVSKQGAGDVVFDKMLATVLKALETEFVQLGLSLKLLKTEVFDDLSIMNENAQQMTAEQSDMKDNMEAMLKESASEKADDKLLDRHIIKALEYIKVNYKNDISIGEVSRYVALSPGYFSRAFKLCTGKSFTDYLLDLRMDKAKSLLKMTALNVSEVSREVGYHDVNYFIRLFKKRVGCTPSKYKKGGE